MRSQTYEEVIVCAKFGLDELRGYVYGGSKIGISPIPNETARPVARKMLVGGALPQEIFGGQVDEGKFVKNQHFNRVFFGIFAS